MKKNLLYFVIPVVIGILLGCAGCNLETTRISNAATSQENPANTENTITNMSIAADAKNQPQISDKTVAGEYKYETYRMGKEGYVNSLGIKDKGDGKLEIIISASYNYPANGAETSKEAHGAGEAQLRGNIAVANVTDENDEPCRVTLTFSRNQAIVKEAEDCNFNVRLGGIYKKVMGKPVAKRPSGDDVKLREVPFGNLADFVNDFDNHRPGDRFIITEVPTSKISLVSRANEISGKGYKGLFYLRTDDSDGSVATSFVTSPQIVKSLEASAKYAPSSLRVTAVLVESSGGFDVYRLSFITKIEGLDEKASVLWTATGVNPAKLILSHD